MRIDNQYNSYINKVSTGNAETRDYIKSLESKYSVNVSVTTFSDKKQLQNYIGKCGGTHNNVAIAPNIANQMAPNSEVAAKYEKIIQDFSDSQDDFLNSCKKNGTDVVSSGMVINEKGEVYYWAQPALVVLEGPDDEKKVRSDLSYKWNQFATNNELYRERQEEEMDIFTGKSLDSLTNLFFKNISTSSLDISV